MKRLTALLASLACAAAMAVIAGGVLNASTPGRGNSSKTTTTTPASSAKPGAASTTNPQVTIAFANAPTDNIVSDAKGAYSGGVNGVVAEFQGTLGVDMGPALFLKLVGTNGKNARYLDFRYSPFNAGCTVPSGVTSPDSKGSFVPDKQWYEIWGLAGMQVGEVRAVTAAFVTATGNFRWMRDENQNYECSNLVAAYRQDLNHWQVATSIDRLSFAANAYGVDANGMIFNPDALGTANSKRVTPGDIAQLGVTLDTFRGNYHMPFKLTAICLTNAPVPPPCTPTQWPCKIY
jgi:hypothetical protein